MIHCLKFWKVGELEVIRNGHEGINVAESRN
jgi:hypothetical protein